MNVPPERLAALLDGTLSPAERAEVLVALDASAETREILADAIAARREVDGTVLPFPGLDDRRSSDRHRRAALTKRAWVAIAAVLVAAVATPLLFRAPVAIAPPDTLMAPWAATASTAVGTLDAVWVVRRGGTGAAWSNAVSVQLGAQLADLSALVHGADPRAPSLAREVAAAIAALPAGGPASTQLESVAQAEQGLEQHIALRAAVNAVEQTAGTDPVRAGAWIQAARLAARTQQESFFEAASTARAMELIAPLARRAESAVSAQVAVREALMNTGPGPLNWTAAERALTELLRSLTRS